MTMPYMNETPCQHGNYACPLCDAVPQNSHSERNTMGPHSTDDLDRFTEAELAALQITISKDVLTRYEEAERLYTGLSRMPYPSAEYTDAKQQAHMVADAAAEADELRSEIGAKLEAIRAARRANADA